jgi:hypothetical protein
MPIRLAPRTAAAAGAAALLLVAAAPASFARWGEHGHRIAAEAAVARLPEAMPAFFKAAGPQLVWLDPDPDRWRDNEETKADGALNGANAPDHFVDLEFTTEGSLRAPNRLAFMDSVRASGQKQLPGFLSFRILELTQRLRVSFRQWRAAPDGPQKRYIEARIINDAGILGHFVTDGANPHHTTMHHNGWVGDNPDGFATDKQMHYRFEGQYVQTHIALGDVSSLVPAEPGTVASLRGGVLDYLKATNGELRTLYTLDKSEKFDDKTTSAAHKDFVARRLAAGATMLRDLWWTAWVTSAAAAPGDE